MCKILQLGHSLDQMPLEGHSAIFDNWSILVGKAFGLRKATYREILDFE